MAKWFAKQNLQIAQDKTEMILLTGRRLKNPIAVKHGEVTVNAVKELKYLGVRIETNQMFKAHIKNVCIKALGVAVALARISPNIRGGGYASRLLYYRTLEAVVLYAAPGWVTESKLDTNMAVLKRVQKTALARVVRAYRTVSHDALCVLAAIPPMALMALERKRIYSRKNQNATEGLDLGKLKTEERAKTLTTWQKNWRLSTTGRWTFRLIPDIRKWTNGGPKILTYRLTQALSGHGCFATYLNKIGRIPSPLCWFGCGTQDDAAHTLFHCKKWERERDELTKKYGELNEDTIVNLLTGKTARLNVECS